MVCVGCRRGFHDGCRGETWCDCQHRLPATGPSWHEVRSAEELTALLQDMEATDPGLPPEILDAVDRALTEDTWIRRERPERKTDDRSHL